MPDLSNRYDRQIRFKPLGADGQRRLQSAGVFLCGCGALGSVMAGALVRAGVGFLRMADPDRVDRTNLHRQALYDEDDAARSASKATAAADHLRKINSEVRIEPHRLAVDAASIEAMTAGVDLILDATDNFPTRFLLNEIAVRDRLPWIYAGVLGSEGRVMPVLPGETACLACLLPECPAEGEFHTILDDGILGPTVEAVGAIAACEAMKILSGRLGAVRRALVSLDLWTGRFTARRIRRRTEKSPCKVCVGRCFDRLASR